MDDHHSRQQIDELAELYLTGSVQEPSDQTEPTPAQEDSAIDGPAPIRLSPKVTATQPPPISEDFADRIEEEIEPGDRHPVLRLTEQDSEQEVTQTDSMTDPFAMATAEVASDSPTPIDRDPMTPDPAMPAPEAALEAVVMANLPGMSGPWLTQYAQLLAQSDGPVALLHIGKEGIDLELIEPRAEAEPAPAMPTGAVRIPPMRQGMSGLVGLLDALVTSDHTPTRTVLVRIETPGDAVTLSRLAAIEDWTVLSGSDDTSTAGVVQQLRSVVRADPRLADRNIGLMVMGSDETAARDASARIATELEDDLVNPVELIGHLKRMQPVQVREIGSFPDPISLWPQLVNWFDSLETPEPITPEPSPQPEPTVQAPPPKAPTPGPVAPTTRLSDQAARLAGPASRPQPATAFQPTPPPPRAAAPRRAAPSPAAAATPAPATTASAQPSAAPTTERRGIATATQPTRPAPQTRVLSPNAELDLVALISDTAGALDSPVALDARLPDQAETQLAVDANGVVHILLKKGSDPFDGGDAASNDPRQAVVQLIEAGRWVRENLELIALTQRDQTFVDEEPVLHLLTDRADLATSLVSKLAGQVRLHLLQQVRIGRESGWFCTPLG